MASMNPVSAPNYQVLEMLSGEISRLDQEVSLLEVTIYPILQGEGTNKDHDVPEEAPYNDLHERVLTLARLNRRLGSITGRIRL